MAIIALESIQLYGKHGCHESEAILGGHYELNISLETDIRAAGISDQIEDTIDYERVYALCLEVFEHRHQLLESLAYEMAHSLKKEFPSARRVEIKLSKLNPPMAGHVGKSTVIYEA